MRIAELFYSIQGEGLLIGVASVFVRTSGCNLRCWWCDTPYTSWDPAGEEMELGEIAGFVKANSTGHVVITGGEPMIAPGIVELTHELAGAGEHITVETAGTVYAPVACDLMSISPKLSNSTPLERDGGRWARQHDRLRIQLEVLKRLAGEYDHQVKFVVTSPGDLDEIRALVSDLNIRPSRVILMPEGTDREILRERGIWLAELCKQHGYRFSPRLHIELWGNRRGV